ncbi:MdtA/MuxA family multidrug efflux RND transporter periplasmic adaptor subunit [Pseudomonas sp. 5P_3.1_Bac2]|uniref:MdtA/MuxA family multidrug efflux RND transporter periplasmic adaptor subunit n=1 Tax=Pseudomonas sp. 5P_3.1_Bac2 TaxID=2971617 RepID=UPI0021C90BC8|nr:MdtA/MuxA family multidrug efflux RND transporter periplasmic adaptor subunit [Pseudomonas sp. 5P_3.1_Bac2]MCU1717121.1 MdtA/MuxA family multidrug efflux RND transporter periplasmic adaptor subunit [Pseudomonas sp. 5P_3.1_Bac2]
MSDTHVSSRSRSQSRQWLLGSAALIILALLLWWFWPAQPQGGVPAGPGGKRPSPFGDGGPVPVRVAPVSQADFAVELKALGTVTAYNTVNVRPRVDGQLVKLLFNDGQQVKAGDLLAVIDPRPFEIALQQAQGALAESQAQLRNAELDLQRYQGLFAQDSIAKQTLDTQQAQVNQLRGSLQSLQANVASAQLNLDFTQVRAPIAGRLGIRQADVGNLVNSSDATPLVVLTQTLPISVIFTLPELELPAVLEQLRDKHKLVVEAWDRSERNKLAEGELESLDNLIDTATGTVKLKARFANAEQSLFPNQFVNVRLRVKTLNNAVLMPAAALQYGANGTFAYVVDGEDKVQQTPVTIGTSNGEMTVVEQGLKVGERVVMEGTDRLRSGNKVEVVSNTPNAAATPKPTEPQQKPGSRP